MTETTDRIHNGWKNYETWAYRLWMMNEQESYEAALDMAREAVLDPQPSEVWTSREAARYTLADMLKAQSEENFPEDIAGVWCDLLNAAVDKIAWDDIAEGLLDDITE